MNRLFERIDNIDSINTLSEQVCLEYGLGNLHGTKVIEIGYEDFNAIIDTETGKYLMKVFRNSRDDEEVKNCINRTAIAGLNNVPTPKVYNNSQNSNFSVINIGQSRFRVALIEYINGENFFDLGQKTTETELDEIVNIAAKLSEIDFKPYFIYDTWAITSFCAEFEKKRKYLSREYLELVVPIYEKFKKFDYDSLPKAYVHGDITSTNLMRDVDNKIWLIDFSVSNYTARLNEIIVICDDVALITGNKAESERRIQHVFDLWCNKVGATDLERDSFKMLFDVANAINIMNSSYEKYTGNTSDETEMHLNAGLFGLTLFNNEIEY